jgi:hypothetical protein
MTLSLQGSRMRRLIAASMRWIKMIEQGFREATPPRSALNRPRLASVPRRTAGSKKDRLEPGVRVTRLSLDTRMVAFGRPFSCGLARPDRSPIRIDFACSSRLSRMAAFCAKRPPAKADRWGFDPRASGVQDTHLPQLALALRRREAASKACPELGEGDASGALTALRTEAFFKAPLMRGASE